jgi:hypothetical protein
MTSGRGRRHLLLNAPQWVQALPWVVNRFVALCGPCHAAYQSGDDVVLAAAYEQSDRSASSPDATELSTSFALGHPSLRYPEKRRSTCRRCGSASGAPNPEWTL